MDLQPSQLPGATASSSTSIPDLESPETKTLRSSARVKAAKQKSLDKEQTSTGEVISSERQSSSSGQHLPDSSISRGTRTKRPREGTSGKGKAKETTEGTSRRRTRRNANTTSNLPLTIQEPVKDPKGKKRAAPEPSSEEDNSAFTSTKRSRTTSYALRSQTSNNQPSTDMPKKTR
ncbi:hypothetical protein L218DRAFT_851812 [Marasmius fiardii PR-910]|nr:hypothetical protein L218DRAFT_851812 [Marasmius fiardii PR-910]